MYIIFIYIKRNKCSHKSRYDEYMELIGRWYMMDDMYELTRKRILYGEITYVYKKAIMIVM